MATAHVLGLAVGPPESEVPLHRVARDSIKLVEAKGVEGDKTFGRSPMRQVNLLSKHTYDWFARNFKRERPLPGGFGENMVISSEIELAWLDLGQLIAVGDAILEVTTPRTPCATLTEVVDGGKVSYFVGHVGLMCAVVKGGEVKTGDAVTLIESP